MDIIKAGDFSMGIESQHLEPKQWWEKFDKDMKAKIRELNDLRARVRELTESESTPQIEGVIDFEFIVGFVSGMTEEAMIKENEIEVSDDAKPYWDLLEWR